MRKFILSLMLITLSLAVHAGDKLSAPTISFLQQRASGITQNDGKHSLAITKTINGVETLDCFITLNSMDIAALKAKGVTVNSVFDGFVTALIPLNKVEEVANLKCVEQIGIARIELHKTDVAKTVTKAEQAWNGIANGLPKNYNGQGVVIGVIDGGIEFNHIAFRDANGNTRIKAAYLPNATIANGGSRPSVGGTTLSGYHYTTPAQIANLTTDDTNESHGTHTSGCAGASTIGGYSGMAPGCDLVLCGLGSNTTETSIVNSAKYIANYAQSVGKPCVISISLGSNIGPHDGANSLCKAYDQIVNQYGVIIMLAAGNEADATGYVSKTLSSTTDAMVVMHEGTDTPANLSGYAQADFWTNNTSTIKVKVMVVNKSDGTIVSQSNQISSGRITSLSGFNSVNIQVSTSISNGRRNIYIYPRVSGAQNSNYRIAYVFTGAAGTKIDGYTDGGYSSVFASTGSVSGYTLTNGQNDGTMCDDICGSKTISVGAMCTRNTGNGSYGNGDIAYWSSFGTDYNGVNHPFITAPGHYIIAPINKLDNYNYPSSQLPYTSYSTTLFGQQDYWDAQSGTSMATPVAAGVVALYLQADPTLDVDDVRDVLINSATAYVNPRSPEKQRGHGIINATAGIQYILDKNYPIPVATEATNVAANGFTANWNTCAGASSYMLRVMKYVPSPIFNDTFAKCTAAASQNIGTKLDNYCDNSGWVGNYVYQAVGGLRMGSASATGYILSPALDLSNTQGKVYVKFTANNFGSDTNCQLTVSCGNSSETVVVENSSSQDFTVALDCTQEANQKIRFATTAAAKRVIVTKVEVYDVEPLIIDNNEPIIFSGITANNYTVSGLLPATAYTYSVKALYGNNESSWSNSIIVTTTGSPVTPIAGDVNGDGAVTSADVTALYSFLINEDMSDIVNGDQNGDGDITSADITAVYTILLNN